MINDIITISFGSFLEQLDHQSWLFMALMSRSSFCSIVYFVLIKYDLGQKYYAPQVRPDQGSNS